MAMVQQCSCAVALIFDVLVQQPPRTGQVKHGLCLYMMPGMMPEHSTVHVLSARVACLASRPHMGCLQMLPVCQDGCNHAQQPWRAPQTASLIMGCSVQRLICVGLVLATCQTARCFSGCRLCCCRHDLQEGALLLWARQLRPAGQNCQGEPLILSSSLAVCISSFTRSLAHS